jgi:hypothetical protein
MSRVLFLEGNPEGFVMVKHAFSAPPTAVPEAETSRLGGNRGAAIEAKEHAGQVDHNESAAFAV